MQVPECIDRLAKAGIKLWVLTGDKMETAVNIGYIKRTSAGLCLYGSCIKLIYLFLPPPNRYACGLLRQDMKEVVITLDSPDILALEKQADKDALIKVHEPVSFWHLNFLSLLYFFDKIE